MDNPLKAIIIGSGVAGLASAIRLAVRDINVTVLEKNDYPGGKLTHFELNNFHFDAGPSLFTQPQNIEELFKLAKEDINEYFEYRREAIACKYFFEDGVVINGYANPEKFAQELNEKTGEDLNRIRKYLRQSAKLYENIGSIFLNHSLHKTKSLPKSSIAKALGTVRWKYIYGSLDSLNRSSFTKPYAVQLFNRFATYNGSNPYKAPGMLSLISHLEYNEGIFYPLGGMISITNALYQLALKKGVHFQFNTPVSRIIHADRKVKGIVVQEKNVYADIVVSNVDVYSTYKYMLNDNVKAENLSKHELSSSAVVFYCGVNKEFPELDLHNIFFTRDYQAEFDHLFKHKTMYSDPTIYINITSKRDDTKHAPASKENWFVMVNAPANVGQDWNLFKQQTKKNVIAKLNRILKTNIESLIEAEETLDPVSIESKTGSFRGALYGASSNSKMAAFLRHPNFSKNIRGLYLAGGTVHPGGGIPLCLKSAKIVDDIVAADIKDNKLSG